MSSLIAGLRSVLVAACVLAASLPALAISLTGNVSFAQGLYTYTYTLDDPTLQVAEVLILVNSHQAFGQLEGPPLSHDTPPGWNFNVYFGGYMGYDPPQHHDASVAYWGWGLNQPRLPGSSPLSFSFVTDRAPTQTPMDLTFAMFTPLLTGGPADYPNFIVGQVVAPDFRSIPLTPPIPEPQVWALMLAGLALIGAVAPRSGRRWWSRTPSA